MSSHGRVGSKRSARTRWHVLSPGKGTKYGHRKVCLGKDQKMYWVHRLVLQAFVGPAPAGMVARHLDGNPENNRLDNLGWGTPAQNAADMVVHGTVQRGTRSPSAKLTEEDVWAIRALRDVVPADYVAARFGVAPGTVQGIWYGDTWRWLDA